MSIEEWLDLRCHPSKHAKTVHTIQARVRRSADAELQMTFRLEGDIPRIRLAAPGTDIELWRHTCFEAFIAVEGEGAYHEFNFAPSGEWAVYALRGYRDGVRVADETMRPRISVRFSDSRLEIDAVVRLDALSAVHSRALLRMGLSAVIETDDGLSYWALRHPRDKPDFHDADGFALRLEAPGPEC